MKTLLDENNYYHHFSHKKDEAQYSKWFVQRSAGCRCGVCQEKFCTFMIMPLIEHHRGCKWPPLLLTANLKLLSSICLFIDTGWSFIFVFDICFKWPNTRNTNLILIRSFSLHYLALKTSTYLFTAGFCLPWVALTHSGRLSCEEPIIT